MSEDFITQIKWLNNTIEVYRGEVDEDTIRRVEYYRPTAQRKFR